MSFPIERIRLGASPITNTIYIGRVNAQENAWLEKREYTDEALAVVRDYLVTMADQYETDHFGYEWTRKDGGIVTLSVTIEKEDTT